MAKAVESTLLPPHDIEAEEAVIASLLADPDAAIEVFTSALKPGDFFREQNRWVYETCFVLYDRGETIDQITVGHELSRRDRLAAAGGPAYLSRVITNLPTSVGARHYAEIVHADAVYRRLMQAGGHIVRMAKEAGASQEQMTEVLTLSMKMIESVAQDGIRHGPVALRELLKEFMDAPPIHEGGILTNWPGLTYLLGSLQMGDLILIAARPSMGKTSLGVDLTRDVVVTQKKRVLFFSLEMGRKQVTTRLIASQAGVDSNRAQAKNILSESEERRVNEAVGVLGDTETWIQDRSYKMEEIEMESRSQSLRYGLDMIVVDYLQLVQGEAKQSRYQIVTETSARLKRLAKDLMVPVVALSQLNRLTEQRADPRPVLSDLRESGSLEQDADIIMFLHNPKGRSVDSRPHPVSLIVAKNRMGQVGTVDLRFTPSVSRFAETIIPPPEDNR